MNYQPPPYTVHGTGVTLLKARRYQSRPRLNDPTLVAVNQQGMLTPEQLTLLANQKYVTFGGCLAMVFAVVLAFFTAIDLASEHFTPTLLLAYLPSLLLFAIGWFAAARRRVARNRFVERIINNGYVYPIIRIQGEVIWHRRYYIAHSPERALRVSEIHLPPGPYHFFCLQDKNTIISTQPIHTYTQMLALPGTLAATGLPGDEQARLAIQQALCQIFTFTPADLEANRLGLITPEQMRKLPRWRFRGSQSVMLTLTGTITTAVDSSNEHPIYYYDINGVRFIVPQFADKALVDGIQYRVYYVIQENHVIQENVLSIEPLEAPLR